MAVRLLVVMNCLLAASGAKSAVFHVGPGMPYETPSQVAPVARDGDVIEIEAANYRGDVAVWRADNLVIRGIGGRPHLFAAGNSAEDKAIWVIKGDNAVVENIEFSGASVEDQNGAGIRLEGANLTIRGSYFHDNENGILTGANPDSEILIEYSEFARNGFGDGYSHNLYVGRVKKLTLRFNYFHKAHIGHQVKSRAETNLILFNRIMDTEDGDSSYLIDLPNAGTATIVGNEIQQGRNAENWTILNSVQTTILINNTFVNDRHGGIFVRIHTDNGESLIQNNIFAGRGSIDAPEAVLVSNYSGTKPGLLNQASFDYRLGPTSPAVDVGAELPKGISVDWEYHHVANRRARKGPGPIDLGAHAYDGGQ